eukprot:TRINITY_DN1857_c0_g2_i1.p1 TRINITY_DN1857_c0_g2~~TRINITY_DN1857_c0_g2_i1.p1  ORF type:complete len:297 (+),score=75.18 TRINITY_DN1857_c0_g2_i1:106-996(+)
MGQFSINKTRKVQSAPVLRPWKVMMNIPPVAGSTLYPRKARIEASPSEHVVFFDLDYCLYPLPCNQVENIKPDAELMQMLNDLAAAGTHMYLFTNATITWALDILRRLAIPPDTFKCIIDVTLMEGHMKPTPTVYQFALYMAGIHHAPWRAVFLDDMVANLQAAKNAYFGGTVLIGNGRYPQNQEFPLIDHHINTPHRLREIMPQLFRSAQANALAMPAASHHTQPRHTLPSSPSAPSLLDLEMSSINAPMDDGFMPNGSGMNVEEVPVEPQVGFKAPNLQKVASQPHNLCNASVW